MIDLLISKIKSQFLFYIFQGFIIGAYMFVLTVLSLSIHFTDM